MQLPPSERKAILFRRILYILLAFIVGYCILFFFKVIYARQINDYELSENLLFYTNHFYRRALWGTLIIKVFHIHSFRPFLLYFYTDIFILVLFYFFFINKNTLLRIIYVTSPLGVCFVLSDPRAFARKESLFIPLIFAAISVLKSSYSQVMRFVCICTLSMVMIILHDAFIFLVFPLLVYLLINANMESKWVIAYCLLMFGLSSFVMSTHPNSNDLIILNNFFTNHKIGWGLTRLAFSSNISTTLRLSFKHHSLFNFVPFVIIVFLHAWLLYYFFRKEFTRHKLFLIIQAIFLIPLLIIAEDYGRWIAFSFFSTCVVLSMYTQKNVEIATYKGWHKLFLLTFLLLCLRIPIWSQFNLFDTKLAYQFINPVILHLLNLPSNNF